MSNYRVCFTTLLSICIIGSVSLIAQTSLNQSNGVPPQGSYDGTSVDTVNLLNGNLVMHIPLPFDYPQRGKLAVKYYLVVNAKTWKANGDPNTLIGQWTPTSACMTGSTGPCGQDPLLVNTATFTMTRIWEKVWTDGQFPQYSASDPDSIGTWDGASHNLAGVGPNAFETSDTSNYRVQLSGDDGNGIPTDVAIIDAIGTQYQGWFSRGDCSTDSNGLPGATQTTTCLQQFRLSTIIDANGNVFSPPASVPLSLAPLSTAHAAVGSESAGCQTSFGTPWVYFINYPAPNGLTNQIKLCFATYPQLATSFSPPNIHQFQDNYSGHPFPGPWRQPVYLSNVILPDSTQWALSYDSYGEISSLTMPTGATVSYQWTEGRFPVCTSNEITTVSRAVQSRQVRDVNGNLSTWSYQWDPQASDGTLTHTVTDPLRNDTVHVFKALEFRPLMFPCDFHEFQTVSYQGTGLSRTPLSQVDISFLTQSNNVSVPTDEKTTLFPSHKVSLVHRDYDPGVGSGTLGLVTTKKTYDFGQDVPGPLLTETHFLYQWQKDSRYATAHIINLPAAVISVDPTGTKNAKTNCPIDGAGAVIPCGAEIDYTYDEPANLQIYPGSLPLGSHVAAPSPVRGNLTTVSKWLDTGSSPVSHIVWYDTGEKSQDIDPMGHTTTYFYDAAYLGAIVTETCNALNQCSSGTYDTNTGLLLSFTEPNASFQASGTTSGDSSHTIFYAYDFMRRMTSASFPDGGLTTFGFPKNNQIDTNMKIDALKTDTVSTFLDGLGRPFQTQHPTPKGVVLVNTTYDGLGRVSSVTNPFLTQTDVTYGATQKGYDALGRTTSTTKQDGTVVTADYSQGNCMTSIDPAGKQRRTCSNSVGGIVEVDEPGGSSPGVAASGSLTINGTLQNTSVGGHGATPGTGSVSITPATAADRSVQVLNHQATPGSVTVVVSGSDSVTQGDCTTLRTGKVFCSPPIYDTGSVGINVNIGGTVVSATASYQSGSTPATIADSLASALGASFTVSHTLGTTSLTLTANSVGSGTNYPISSTCSSSQGNCGWHVSFFQANTTVATTTFTGGTDNTYNTVYDSGTATITVNGYPNKVSYGQNDTAATIAANLAAQINADPAAFVNATAASATVTLTSRTLGSAANVTFSSSITYDTGHFNAPLFGVSNSGASLAGGTDAVTGTGVYDSGTVSLSIGTFTATVPYGQSTNSSADTVASALVAALNNTAAGSPVMASSSGATISITYLSVGASGNVAVSASSQSTQTAATFAPPSFTSAGTTLSNGSDPQQGSLAHPNVTLYSYDGLGNLACVVQKGLDTAVFTSCGAAPAAWRPRLFTYDSLSRVRTVTTPESGLISYTYDADGSLFAETRPAPNQGGAATVTITYAYDKLHRVTQRSFSDTTPLIKFGFDGIAPPGCVPPTLTISNGIGRMTSMCDAAGAEAWSYDPMGRPKVNVRQTNGVTKPTTYSYTANGSLNQVIYPSGRTITYSYDAIGRPVSAGDSAASLNYVASVSYDATGSVNSLTNGANIVSTFYYNNRLQPCRLSVQNSGTVPASCADALNSGNIMDYTYDFGLKVSDNGNLYHITNNRDTTRSQTFTYDALNRLATAQTDATSASSAAHCWGERFGYDAWGSLLSIDPSSTQYSGCTQENLAVSVTAKNQLLSSAPCFNASGGLIATSTFCYDSAGNLLTDGSGRINVFNANHQLTSTAGVNYVYDGRGNRVMKSNGKIYWYGAGHNPLDETDLSGNLVDEYIFFGGKRTARRHVTAGQPDTVTYYLADHLNTTRMVVDATGKALDDSDFFPYGGQKAFLSSSGNRYLFTGMERDPESGLDDMGARFNQSQIGRFISPDPLFITTTRVAEPQRLNQYSYAADNPLRYVDPSGTDSALSSVIDKINNLEATARSAAIQSIADSRAGKLVVTTPAMSHLVGEAVYYQKQLEQSTSNGPCYQSTLCMGNQNGFEIAFNRLMDAEEDALVASLSAELDLAANTASLTDLLLGFFDVAVARYEISPDDPEFGIKKIQELLASGKEKDLDELTDKLAELIMKSDHGPIWKKIAIWLWEVSKDNRQNYLRDRTLSRLQARIMATRPCHIQRTQETTTFSNSPTKVGAPQYQVVCPP